MPRIASPVLLAFALLPRPGVAADWPQWLGPTRNGVWTEPDVLTAFPDGGPKKRWQVPAAGGYSGPAVVDGRVYLTEYVRSQGDPVNDPLARPKLAGSERVRCLDAKTGKELWKHAYPCAYHISYPCGPRCTPTVADGRVYALGAMGHLTCLTADTGKVVWQKDFRKDLDARVPIWGFAAHPLVVGKLLVCMVGAPTGAVVAFDTADGTVKWKALPNKAAGYCPPTVTEVDGKPQLIVWPATELAGLRPDTGEPVWQVSLKPLHAMAVAAPQRSGDYLYAGAYDALAVLLKFEKGKDQPTEVWRGDRNTAVAPTNSTPLIHDGTLFGCDASTGALRAVDLSTGKRLWKTHAPTTGASEAPHGTAFLTRNGDRYFLMSETGELVLARMTAKGYKELGRAKLIEPTGTAFGRPVAWAAPAFADRHIFVRNDKCIACFDLTAK